MLVERFAGAGTYQVTATLFGVDCAVPGNAGRSCDDGNACTSGDTCQAGACTGTAPALGCKLPTLPQKGVFQLKDDLFRDIHVTGYEGSFLTQTNVQGAGLPP